MLGNLDLIGQSELIASSKRSLAIRTQQRERSSWIDSVAGGRTRLLSLVRQYADIVNLRIGHDTDELDRKGDALLAFTFARLLSSHVVQATNALSRNSCASSAQKRVKCFANTLLQRQRCTVTHSLSTPTTQ